MVSEFMEWWEYVHYYLKHPPGYTTYRNGKPERDRYKREFCPFCHPEILDEW